MSKKKTSVTVDQRIEKLEKEIQDIKSRLEAIFAIISIRDKAPVDPFVPHPTVPYPPTEPHEWPFPGDTAPPIREYWPSSICGVCKTDLSQATHYVCNRSDCPSAIRFGGGGTHQSG